MAVRNLVFIALAGLAMRAAQGQPLQVINVGNESVGYLGINCVDVDAERAKALKLPEEAGTEVTVLVPNSPAAAAGMRIGDVVMNYNGQRVEGWIQLSRLISDTPAGREVRIQVFRKEYRQLMLAKIVSLPKDIIQVPVYTLSQPPLGGSAFPDMPVARTSWRNNGLGSEWETVDGQLAMSLGAHEGGVLVRSVTRGSAAERGDLRAGDIIIRVGDARVMTPADVSARIRAGRAQSATVTIVRERREMNLTIPLDGVRPVE